MADRDVIPSHLGIQSTPTHSDGGMFDNLALRYGEVQEIIYPDDPKSRSKKFVEYNVFVQHKVGGAGAGVIYYNCMLSNVFGAFADEVHYMLRVPETPSTKDTKAKFGLGAGAKVLLLCQNGERSNAYIVGGKRDPDRDDRDKKSKDLGHFLSFVFNGIKVFIDKDGQLQIQYSGATDIEGKNLADADAVGTQINFFKNGNWTVTDKDDVNRIFLNHADGEVTIQRKNKFVLGSGDDAMIMGTTYRNAQKKAHNKMKSSLMVAKQLLSQAATQMQTAGSRMVTPVAGAVSAAPSFVLISQLLDQAATKLGDVGDAINDFESNSSDYLSGKNFLDA